jgi:hypothetical protein
MAAYAVVSAQTPTGLKSRLGTGKEKYEGYFGLFMFSLYAGSWQLQMEWTEGPIIQTKFVLWSSKQVQSKTRLETKSNFFDKKLIYSSSIYVEKKVPRLGPFSIGN